MLLRISEVAYEKTILDEEMGLIPFTRRAAQFKPRFLFDGGSVCNFTAHGCLRDTAIFTLGTEVALKYGCLLHS